MTKKIKSWLNIIVLTAVLILPGLVFASDRLTDVAVTYGPFSAASSTSLASMLGIVIKAALSLLGIIFLIITILAGYKWMTAQGNEANVEKAKESLTRAVIGLLVTLSAWAIWMFISLNFIKQV